MADQASGNATSGVDPISGFWRDVWARCAAGGAMPGMAGMPGMPGMPGLGTAADAAGTFMSPEALRRMQAAFYDAMAQYAEQYMRSPDFLASMRRSMDQAMQFRQQMDDFLKSNMATAFESATGGANSEILGAIRQTSAQVQAQIAKLEGRLTDIETRLDGTPKSAKPAAAPRKKNSKK